MLVITRKLNEEILIGDDIRIVLCGKTRNNTVRIGIDAPGRRVVRKEVAERISRGESKPRSDSDE